MFAVFKLIGGLLCLATNITVLLRSGSIEDVVKDYVAVAIISAIDNQMASTFNVPGFETDLKLYISKERARLTDAELFDEFVLDRKKGDSALQQTGCCSTQAQIEDV